MNVVDTNVGISSYMYMVHVYLHTFTCIIQCMFQYLSCYRTQCYLLIIFQEVFLLFFVNNSNIYLYIFFCKCFKYLFISYQLLSTYILLFIFSEHCRVIFNVETIWIACTASTQLEYSNMYICIWGIISSEKMLIDYI